MFKPKGKKLTENKRSKLTPVDFSLESNLKEGISMNGVDSGEDYGWRSLTAQVKRDLSPLAQKRMQEISFYLYDSNPMAHRIIEMGRDFIIGDGFRYMAKDERVQDVLDAFWNDPDNNWNIKQDKKVLELSLWGEQCYPVYINPHNGHVKLGYLDPGLITNVKLDPNNPERVKEIHWSKRSKVIKWKAINTDNRVSSKTSGKLIGDCFYFAINNVSFSSRGRGDLLTLADWIDGHDQFLFARLERAFFLNNYIWDILCEGMNKKEIEEFAKGMKTPAPGSARVHNEKVTYNTVNPKLESADASAEANLFKGQILAGAGYPGHWFCHSEDTQILTEDGWKFFWELDNSKKIASYNIDENSIRFVVPNKIYKYDYKGDMYEIKTRNVDICVSPNHQLLTFHKFFKTKRFETRVIEAKDLKLSEQGRTYFKAQNISWKGKTIKSIKIGDTDYPIKPFMEFLGYFISEGYIDYNKGYRIGLSQTKKDIKDKMKQVFKQLKLHYCSFTDKQNSTSFYIFKKDLWMFLYNNVNKYSENKTIPRYFLNLNKDLLVILFDALMDGDGSWSKGSDRTSGTYYTCSKKLCDTFQELCLKIGITCQIGAIQRNTYSVHVSQNRDKFCVKNNQIKKVKYSGKIYSVNVDDGFYISRRNGKIGIHHNSEGDKTTRATAQEMAAPTLKKLKSRQKYVKYMLQYIFAFVIDQKIIHGMLPKDIDKKVIVMPAPIITKDARGLAITTDKFANAMTVAVDKGWISEDTARIAFRTFMTDLGIELHELEELVEYAQAYKKAKGGKDEKEKPKDKDEDESKSGS